MRLYWLAILFALLAGSAQAQTAPPFEPYTVTEQMQQALLDHLYRNVPQVYADPIRQALGQWEQQAQQKKVADDAKAAAEKAKDKK